MEYYIQHWNKNKEAIQAMKDEHRLFQNVFTLPNDVLQRFYKWCDENLVDNYDDGQGRKFDIIDEELN